MIDSGAKASSIQASNIKPFKKGRNDFNNLLLSIFSLFGVFTVLSGFLLWGTSSKTVRTLLKKSR